MKCFSLNISSLCTTKPSWPLGTSCCPGHKLDQKLRGLNSLHHSCFFSPKLIAIQIMTVQVQWPNKTLTYGDGASSCLCWCTSTTQLVSRTIPLHTAHHQKPVVIYYFHLHPQKLPCYLFTTSFFKFSHFNEKVWF
jgi:hypothetical protein